MEIIFSLFLMWLCFSSMQQDFSVHPSKASKDNRTPAKLEVYQTNRLRSTNHINNHFQAKKRSPNEIPPRQTCVGSLFVDLVTANSCSDLIGHARWAALDGMCSGFPMSMDLDDFFVFLQIAVKWSWATVVVTDIASLLRWVISYSGAELWRRWNRCTKIPLSGLKM